MEIGQTLYIINREDWRAWLQENHDKAREIWLVYHHVKSGKPRIPYDVAVEEALCFGWIDSIVKKHDAQSSVQRFTPRRKNSQLSELNRVRVKKLIEQGLMTEAGLQSINHHLLVENGVVVEHKPFTMPADITKILHNDPVVWLHFCSFPEHYKQIRIASIDQARSRPDIFTKRLNYFIKMTRRNKLFGSQVY